MSFTWKCGDTYHTVARHGCGCNAVNREGKTLAKQSMKVVLRGCRKVDGRVDIDEGPHRLLRDALRLRLSIKRGDSTLIQKGRFKQIRSQLSTGCFYTLLMLYARCYFEKDGHAGCVKMQGSGIPMGLETKSWTCICLRLLA